MKIKKRLSVFGATLLSLICLGGYSITTEAATAIPDPDGDGEITVSDAVLVARYLDGQIATSSATANYDVNGNGIVSQMDYKLIMLYIAGIWKGGN